MKFNAAQLLLEHLGSIREHEVEEPPHQIDDGVRVVTPIRGRLKLTRTNRGIVADARLHTDVEQQCSRCLDDVIAPVDLRILEEFYPTVDFRTGLAATAPEGGSGFMMTEAHEVDLDEPIRQGVLLELPMKPLCRADCAGLCPRCGQNFNERICDCVEEPPDPRLAALADLLKPERLH